MEEFLGNIMTALMKGRPPLTQDERNELGFNSRYGVDSSILPGWGGHDGLKGSKSLQPDPGKPPTNYGSRDRNEKL